MQRAVAAVLAGHLPWGPVWALGWEHAAAQSAISASAHAIPVAVETVAVVLAAAGVMLGEAMRAKVSVPVCPMARHIPHTPR